MKYLILLSIFFIALVSLSSCESHRKYGNPSYNDYSNYYKKISLADSLYILGKYTESNYILSDTFTSVLPINTF